MEALPAVNRLVAAWLERDFRSPPALAADGLVHLALTATAATTTVTAAGVSSAAAARGALRLTCGPAIRATIRFVLEAFGGEKFLFSGAKGELRVTIRAGQGLISVHT